MVVDVVVMTVLRDDNSFLLLFFAGGDGQGKADVHVDADAYVDDGSGDNTGIMMIMMLIMLTTMISLVSVTAALAVMSRGHVAIFEKVAISSLVDLVETN